MSLLSHNPAAAFSDLLLLKALRRRSKRSMFDAPAPLERDIVHIDGGLHDVRSPLLNEKSPESTVHAILRFGVSFILSKPLDVKRIMAKFEGAIDAVDARQHAYIPILQLQWTLWDKGVLASGRKYKFEIAAEISPNVPCSVESENGSIEYMFRVLLEGVNGDCTLRTREVKVWNPYMVFDVPRMGLAWSDSAESNMVGMTVELNKALTAFVRYPDQSFTDHSFPLEVSFPKSSQAELHSVTQITIRIFQHLIFVVDKTRKDGSIKDTRPVTSKIVAFPAVSPQSILVPLLSLTLGRFTSERFRISHTLRIVFHRRWAPKFVWVEDIELFQRNEGVDCSIGFGVTELSDDS